MRLRIGSLVDIRLRIDERMRIYGIIKDIVPSMVSEEDNVYEVFVTCLSSNTPAGASMPIQVGHTYKFQSDIVLYTFIVDVLELGDYETIECVLLEPL